MSPPAHANPSRRHGALRVPAERHGAWGAWALPARFAGALALLAVGVVHLREYVELYSAIPTIGTLFLLNFAGAGGLSMVLLGPVERWGGRRGELLAAVAALAGVAHAAIGFVFLEVSEHGTLFGFHEPGYDPAAMAIAQVAEVAAVALLGAYLIVRLFLNASTRRW